MKFSYNWPTHDLLFILGFVLFLLAYFTDHWVDFLGDTYGLWNYCNLNGCHVFQQELLHGKSISMRLFLTGIANPNPNPNPNPGPLY